MRRALCIWRTFFLGWLYDHFLYQTSEIEFDIIRSDGLVRDYVLSLGARLIFRRIAGGRPQLDGSGATHPQRRQKLMCICNFVMVEYNMMKQKKKGTLLAHAETNLSPLPHVRGIARANSSYQTDTLPHASLYFSTQSTDSVPASSPHMHPTTHSAHLSIHILAFRY